MKMSINSMRPFETISFLLLLLKCSMGFTLSSSKTTIRTQLHMGVDPVTYLRTEWVSAALCTNQIPRTAKSVLQIGTDDARVINFIPRTVEELITSSLQEDGKLSLSCRRQLKQQRDARGSGMTVRYLDQRADNLVGLEDESVDAVVSLLAADKMRELGIDWKKSIQETARVLKKGGRFLFVEKTVIGEKEEEYLDTLMSLQTAETKQGDEFKEPEAVKAPVFELIGYDDVDLVLTPHIAGVVVKSELAGLTSAEIAARSKKKEQERIADLTIDAFERGLKKRKMKKKESEDKGLAKDKTESKK